jgi:hypothetical protein
MTPDEEKIIAAIPAEFHMISGSADVQTSADVFNVNKVPCCPLCREFTCITTFFVAYSIILIATVRIAESVRQSGWCLHQCLAASLVSPQARRGAHVLGGMLTKNAYRTLANGLRSNSPTDFLPSH